MKYKLITTRKNGQFCQSLTFDTLKEAETFGYNHTKLEKYFINDIPVKNERLFRVYEITPKFNVMEVI